MDGARRFLYRIAAAYYEDNLTQAEIADRFGISSVKAFRMLTRARGDGVVMISVVPQVGVHTDLEQALERTFGLDEAIVAESGRGKYEEILEWIGRAAAE